MSSSSVVLIDRANHFTDEYFSVLTDRKFTVRRVTSLEEAEVAIAQGRGEAPDLLLLNGSGRPPAETVSDLVRLRERHPDLPVILLVLAPDPALAARARALGAAAVLAAPWLPRDVVAAFEQASETRRRRLAAARARTDSYEVVRARLEAETRRANDLERANARLARELEAAREAASRIGETLKLIQRQKATLDTRLAQMRAVAALSASLAGRRDGETIAELVVREAARLLGADAAALRLLDDGQPESLRPRFVLGGGTAPLAEIRRGEGIQGWVAETGRPLVVSDASRDPRVLPQERAGRNGERIACVPVAVRDRILGTLILNRTGKQAPFTSGDLELLATLAAQAGVALYQAEQAAAIEQGYLASMHALVRSIEARDPARVDHSDNVAFFSLRLARAIGLDEARQTVLRRAALLHDVGQALISTAISGKRDRFTPTELAVMREHPVLGHQMLEPVEFLGEARAVVRDHHERFDGAGYPDGRCGEDLSLETRIVSIAEAFDSMTRERAYGPALSVEAAVAELRAHRRTQFDPDLVDRFVELIDSDGTGTDLAEEAPRVAEAAGGGAAA